MPELYFQKQRAVEMDLNYSAENITFTDESTAVFSIYPMVFGLVDTNFFISAELEISFGGVPLPENTNRDHAALTWASLLPVALS